jgi:two-component system, cell cycle response regulator
MTRQTVLVADDSGVVRAMLRRQLEARGLRVEEAADGHEALRACASLRPDVVLLDVDMPGLDGHSTLRRIRDDAGISDIPVVFLTARTSTEDVVTGLQLGAHDYLRKPFEPSELIARVSAALRVKSLQDQLRQRNAQLELVSRTDALTGVSNRRHLEERLQEMLSAARRHGQPSTVLVIDIDHFKSINDSLGHAGGDAVLRSVVERVARSVRREDVVGRWGGEEFLVLGAMTDVAAAGVLAERVREAVCAEPVRVDGGDDVAVTVSIGCAAGTEPPDTLLRRADVALYEAKAKGRNRVVVAAPALP